jgi:polysaccharide chain length determinant protein (PEP-CTERM system associated)
MGGVYDEVRIAIHAIWTRRWLALAVAWGICVAGWFVVAQMPSRYESRARVFVQVQSVLPGGAADAAQASDNVDTIRQTLTSAVNLEKVVRGTDLANSVATDRDVADRVAGLQGAIKITAQQNNLFEIVTTGSSPKLARQITQKLIDLFVEQNLSDDRTSTSQSLRFLDGQLAGLQKQLSDAEAKRADFQNRYLGALPGTGSVSDRIGTARGQIADIDGQLAAAQSSLGAANAQMAGVPASIAGTGGTAGGMAPAHARVAAINGQLADARARGDTEDHPDVIALKRQLAIAQGAAAREPASTGGVAAGMQPNPAFQALRATQADRQAQVSALQTRRAELQHDLDTLNEKLSGDPEAAAGQAQIDRDYQVLKDRYDELFGQRQQIAMKGQAQTQTDTIKFSVIDPPTNPRTPTAPNRPLLLTGVLIAGLLGGLGAAFAMGQVQTTFPTAARLEKAAGMPVIGSIGEMVTHLQMTERRRRLQLFAGGSAALGVAYVALLGVEMLQRGLAA